MPIFQTLKIILENASGVPRSGFHLILGILVFWGTAKILKIPLNSKKSLIPPILFAFALESLDLCEAWIYHYWFDWTDSIGDILTTVFIPTLIFLLILRSERSSGRKKRVSSSPASRPKAIRRRVPPYRRG
ncbi:MAG: hypothetical protein G01um101418_785 [Parcubacteria group bacterium Gr01-1014_18]|nr:MAG: hypothetical protein G01um101418_785 [Parcubacteria group bacterium Gr01-1014_18]TSC99364.1 MAG: hypothetical protein Greene101420_292 [Parcubacteria group bacterium Greene1014_20]